MKRFQRLLAVSLTISVFLLAVFAVYLQQFNVTAEAIIEANLRAATDVNSDLVGSIQNGTAYPVIGRSEFFPWLLIGSPDTGSPLGWVYSELVTVRGDLTQVPFSTQVINSEPVATSTEPPQILPTATLAARSDNDLVGVSISALATPTATLPAGILGRVSGEVNIRYGPGVDYPRIGVAEAGDMYEITGYHTTFPWVQIRYDAVAGGFGWIANDLIEIDGNVFSLPAISRTDFSLPTLTPTPDAVVAASGLPGLTTVALSPEFKALGERLWDLLLEGGFEPETSRLGSLFLMDLQTGETIALGDGLAYSGMSLSKINILVTLYQYLDRLPTGEEARQLANMMICSENTSSNQVLTYIGGDPYSGAANVTRMIQQLGLRNSFMVAPFLIDPRITPQPVVAPLTSVDQTRTNPDPFNQMTVTELGWMFYSIYQCAADGTGPLVNSLGGTVTQRECQQMLYLMSGNRIGALIEVGVPADVDVAHKHGWIDDTHGDAGIVFTPGGNYVLVVVLHNPIWLNFEESFPLIEEISRIVYNYYNPDTPMANTRTSNVPETCDLNTAEGIEIIDALMRGDTPQ